MTSIIYKGKRVISGGTGGGTGGGSSGPSSLGNFLIPQGKVQRSGLRRAYSGYILQIPLIGHPNTTIVTRTR